MWTSRFQIYPKSLLHERTVTPQHQSFEPDDPKVVYAIEQMVDHLPLGQVGILIGQYLCNPDNPVKEIQVHVRSSAETHATSPSFREFSVSREAKKHSDRKFAALIHGIIALDILTILIIVQAFLPVLAKSKKITPYDTTYSQ